MFVINVSKKRLSSIFVLEMQFYYVCCTSNNLGFVISKNESFKFYYIQVLLIFARI